MEVRRSATMYWPAAIASCSGIALALGAALQVESIRSMVFPAEVALASLAGFLFLLLLIDPEARRAVDAYNSQARRRTKRCWSEWIFPPGIDRRLMSLALAAWAEIAVLNLRGAKDLAVLPCLSFFVAGLMAMLMMKRSPLPRHSPEAGSRSAEREAEFWIGGDGGD